MSSFSDYLENEILDHIFGGSAWAAPANLHLALFTVAPNDAGTGGTEVTGGAYVRLSVTNSLANFPAASGGTKSNANALDFIEATANWGTIVFVGIYDAASAGNYLGGAPLAANKTINTGDVFRIKAGDLDLTLT